MLNRQSVLIICLLLVSCVQLDPGTHRGPGWYQVKPTDTLYSIAWRYGLDYQQLADWNQISPPYLIKPGDQIALFKLSKPQPAQPQKSADKPLVVPVKQPTDIEPKEIEPQAQPLPVTIESWSWPANGKVISRFSAQQLDQRGIDIAGKIGQPVLAANAGRVVYSGDGLIGYGNLIIIKHNDQWLSAYAYNRKRLVSEGDNVAKGEKIAEMGTDKNNTLLHFQIRKNGVPVDPLKYLPAKQ